jgi:hypothetical protein
MTYLDTEPAPPARERAAGSIAGNELPSPRIPKRTSKLRDKSAARNPFGRRPLVAVHRALQIWQWVKLRQSAPNHSEVWQ